MTEVTQMTQRDRNSAGRVAAAGAEPVTLRAVTPDDRSFLCRLYGSTRAAELAPLPWTDEQKQTFIAMQFDAQDHHYREHYSGAAFDVIMVDGAPIGRLYVARGADEIRIIDIALVPECCNRGIGSALLRGLQDEARASGLPLRIHVERFNPALRLYERLGFRMIADRGVYLFLEWAPHAVSGRGHPARNDT